MGIDLLFARLEVLHRLLNSRRVWVTMFPSHPTSPRGPVECLQVVMAKSARRLRFYEQLMQQIP